MTILIGQLLTPQQVDWVRRLRTDPSGWSEAKWSDGEWHSVMNRKGSVLVVEIPSTKNRLGKPDKIKAADVAWFLEHGVWPRGVLQRISGGKRDLQPENFRDTGDDPWVVGSRNWR